MVQETFLLEVKPGTEQEFQNAFQQTTIVLSSAKGYLGYELQRCVEQENKYLVIIQWETIEDHIITFKHSPAFEEMKSLIGPYYLTVPTVEHYRKVDF